MADVKERVNTLEHALGSFIIQTEKAITSLSNDVKSLNKEMKEFKDEMRVFKDEMRGFKDDMKDFKDEMRGFKDDMKDFKDEMREEHRRMNKKWGEISNKLGSIAEDIAAPGLHGIIQRHFNTEPDRRMDTLYIRNAKDKDKIREFDVIAVTEQFFFVCEIKSTPRNDYVKEFIDLVKSDKIFEYFPEYKDRILIPVFSSFELPKNIVKHLSKNKILAMAMGDDHMEIINKDLLALWIS